MDKMLFAVVLALAAAGCETVRPGPRRGYLDPNEDQFGRADRMEYTQKHRSVVDVFEKMKIDKTVNYIAAKERAKVRVKAAHPDLAPDVVEKIAKPTIAVRPIENNTGDGRSDSAVTGQMYREIINQLRKTDLFEMIDYARRSQMKKTVVAAVDDGENAANLQHIGEYTSADFIMTGELRREETDDGDRVVYHHFLNLEMTDTSTGTVFWNDTAQPTAKYE